MKNKSNNSWLALLISVVLFSLIVASCTKIPPQPTPIDYDAVYKYPKDQVYQACIESLTSVGLMLQSENKDVGVITADGSFGKEEAQQMTNFKPSRLFVAMSVLVNSVSDEATQVRIRTAMSGKRTPVFNTIMWGAIGFLASERNPELTSNGTLEIEYMNQIQSNLEKNYEL